MTDKEIKKAFNDALILDCMNIELWHDKEDKPIFLPIKEVAGLINRLQAESERLKYLLDYEEKKYALCAKRFFKEGVKEFAERLKSEIDIRPTYSREQNKYVFFLINNLLKELVGEDK